MTRVYFAIAACAAILSLAHATTKVPVPSAEKVLMADDGGPLPPPCQPDPPSNV
jgi:hypothetical protein